MENVSGHHVATNLDNKIKSCCSVDLYLFFESVFLNLITFILWVYDDPANNITTMFSMIGKEGIICVPSNVSSFGQQNYAILLSYLPTPRVQKPGDNPKNFQSGSLFY